MYSDLNSTPFPGQGQNQQFGQGFNNGPVGQGFIPTGPQQGQGFNQQGQGFNQNPQVPGKGMGHWTQEVGGKDGKAFCEIPTAVRFVKVRYGAVIDSIQIVCSDFQGAHHGGTGGK